MLYQLGPVKFPEPEGIMINMMPIVCGDKYSVPAEYAQYMPMIERAQFPEGSVVYLTINESFVRKGETQRRGGIHTDGTKMHMHGGSGAHGGNWGGGNWGGAPVVPPTPQEPKKKQSKIRINPENAKWKLDTGIYMASTDGLCRGWDTTLFDVDDLGAVLCELPEDESLQFEPSTLYWMTDRTPHESLPAEQDGMRQFFRLVGPDVSVWWAQHNTPNRLGVQPNAEIRHYSKFGG